MNIRNYAPGEIIIAEGTIGYDSYRLQKGRIVICKETGSPSGRIPIAVLEEGEMFGEMFLLSGSGFRTASVIAETAVTVEIVSIAEMQDALNHTPELIQSLLHTLSCRLADTSQENGILKMKQQETPWSHLYRKYVNG